MVRLRFYRVALAALVALSVLLAYDLQGVAADSIYTPANWNGKKVYLSPALHSPDNIGCDSYAESTGARSLSFRVKDYLYARGYSVRIGSGTYVQNTASSNAWLANIHIPIHSNATTFDCTAPFSPALGGTWLMFEPGSTASSNLAQKIFDAMKASSPGTWDLKGTDEALAGFALYELRNTNMPGAYVEAAFHTYRPDVDWLRITGTVGNKIGVGIDNYFGNPRCPPSCPSGPEWLTIESTMAPASRYQADSAGATRSPSIEAAILRALSGLEPGSAFSGTSGQLNTVMVTPDGVAIVDLKDIFSDVASASTTAVAATIVGELVGAVLSDPTITGVELRTDGSCSGFWAHLEADCQLIER